MKVSRLLAVLLSGELEGNSRGFRSLLSTTPSLVGSALIRYYKEDNINHYGEDGDIMFNITTYERGNGSNDLETRR